MKILWLGDFFYDYDYVTDDIKKMGDWIRKNNYNTVLNLEGTIDCSEFSKIEKRGPNLSSDKAILDVFKELNVVAVTLANNHIMDYGEEGLKHTISLLEENNIKYTGAQKNLDLAIKPIVLNCNNKDIAIYSFGWNIEETIYATKNTAGCAPRNNKLIKEVLESAEGKYSRKIVCMHWGFEYNRLPMPYDIELGHLIIDSGCDFIIGNHPHCIQPMERYEEKNIYYALGNFYFGSRRKRFCKKFSEKITNQSDFGLVVEYDTDCNETTEYMIEYVKDKDKSKIIEVNKDVFKRLNKIRYNDKGYYNEVKKSKVNINPILTTNAKSNKIKINILFLNYKIRRVIKSLIGKR